MLSIAFNYLSMFWHFNVTELSCDVISGTGSEIFEKQPLRLRLSFVVFSIFFEFLNWILKLTYWTRFCMYRFFIQTGSTELEPPKLKQFFQYFWPFQASFFTYRFQFILQNMYKSCALLSVPPRKQKKKDFTFLCIYLGPPEKRPKSLKLLEILKRTLVIFCICYLI